MNKVNFTAGRVAGFECEAGKRQSLFWDAKTPGLGLRVSDGGSKSFIFESRLHGKTIRTTIGDIRTWTIAKAQAEAVRLKAMCDQGIDPRQDMADKKAAAEAKQASKRAEQQRASLLAREAWNAYRKRRILSGALPTGKTTINLSQPGGEPKKRGKGTTMPGPLASLLDKPLAIIDAKTLAAWLDAEKQLRPTASLNAYRKFRAFINWCAESDDYRQFVQVDCYRSKAIRDTMPEKRTKEGDCLQREQLPLWFAAVRRLNNPVIAAYLQGLLLTGARREELAGLRWVDVDFQWGA